MSIVRHSNVFDPFSLDLWDPFDSIRSLLPALVNTRVDWKETAEAHVFKTDFPGVKKVEVEEGRGEKEEKNDKWHRVEQSSGKFLRRFWLPENAKVNEVKATMENGVLTVTVTVSKEEVKRPEVKTNEISG